MTSLKLANESGAHLPVHNLKEGNEIEIALTRSSKVSEVRFTYYVFILSSVKLSLSFFSEEKTHQK